MNKIRKGDQVVVLSGRDKGRKGAVLQVLADGRVVVESVNRKPTPNESSASPTPANESTTDADATGHENPAA